MTVLMLVILWAAAIYRVALSMRLPAALWRSAFTTCIVFVALAATANVFADQYIERPLRIWNLTMLLVHLLLLAASGSCMVYLVTLKQARRPRGAVAFWTSLTGIAAVVQVASWAGGPIHTQPTAALIVEYGYNVNVAVFNASFILFMAITTTATAQLCFARLVSPTDLTRTISLSLTGAACAAATVMFGLWMAAVILRYLDGGFEILMALGDRMMPLVLIVLALGTLSLMLAPPVLDFVRSYRVWRTLEPLWRRLVSLQPSIHLDLPAQGTPTRRIQTRIQRAVVEIHDALRLTRVDLGPGATVDELGRALRSPAGQGRAAAELLSRASSREEDIAQLARLARTYVGGRQ